MNLYLFKKYKQYKKQNKHTSLYSDYFLLRYILNRNINI